MRTVTAPAARLGAPRSKRLLALAGDERLVDSIRRGDELAFEVAFERHSPAILSFCRHMLGSREEAEDAVQQAFTSAFRDLQGDAREIKLKPWLFTIARNRCLSMLRARRERAFAEPEIATAGLAEQVERRGELRDLLRDLDDLPEQQRAALLMAELSGLSHAEIGGVLDCGPHKVKALVFSARSGLIERRDAREAPCLEIREELANLRGGALRRGRLRHHLRVCEGCREYRSQLKRQRSMLAAVLPVAPTLGLKGSVLGAIGLGGGSAGGGALLGGGAMAVKVATVCVLAGGGVVAGERAIDSSAPDPDRATVAPAPQDAAASQPAAGRSAVDAPRAQPGRAIGVKRERAGSRHGPQDPVRRGRPERSHVPPGQAKKVAAPDSESRGRGRSGKARAGKDKSVKRTKHSEQPKQPKQPKTARPARSPQAAAPPRSAAPGQTTSALRRVAREERKAAKGR